MSSNTVGLNVINWPNYFELSCTLKTAFSGDRFNVEEHCGHFNVLYVMDVNHITPENARITSNILIRSAIYFFILRPL